MNNLVKIITLSGLFLFSSIVNASFQLETMTVLVDASEPRTVFSVKNITKEPILLSSKVVSIDEQDIVSSKDIIISPPITRIEPEQSQQINFVVRKGAEIQTEAILKVSFQGVGAAKTNVARMPIRQDIAMLITPKGISINNSPWNELRVSQKGDQLTLKNMGKQVVRLVPNIITMPNNESYNLEQYFIRPNESKSITVKNKLDEIKFTPLSRYGFKVKEDAVIKVIQE